MSNNPDKTMKDLSDRSEENGKDLLLRSAAIENEEVINETLPVLCRELGLQNCNTEAPEGFAMYKNLNAVIVHACNRISNDQELQMLIADYSISHTTSKGQRSEANSYFFGRMHLSKKYPQTYICKETIREKLTELFAKRETDFPEHKKFSDKFYVLTNDPSRLTALLRFAPMDELVNFPELELEIQGNDCFYRCSHKPLSLEEAMQHVALTKVLLRIFR
ncbi:MAG: hypothetical protein DI535_21370 [Citrobacter freundii]|nr:MAG: hypothetical protein DI535_21370 [Citrobacter freundii]